MSEWYYGYICGVITMSIISAIVNIIMELKE